MHEKLNSVILKYVFNHNKILRLNDMFVRSLLAVSLSCLMFNTAFAEEPSVASSVQQSSVTAEDPINPLAIDNTTASQIMEEPASTASDVQMTQQEQKNFDQVTQAVQDIDEAPETEKKGVPPVEKPKVDETPTAKGTKAEKSSWTLDNLNNINWYENIGKGQFPVYARAQVMLNNMHASSGAIDGTSGKNMLKAVASFQQMNGLKPTGVLDKGTWDALVTAQNGRPAYIEYTLTDADIKGPYAQIPHDYALQAKMKGLYYSRVTEMLGEKFHIDEGFLKQLNPKANFNKVGQKVLVPNVRNNLPEDIHLIIAHKGAKQLYLFNAKNQMVGSFPATIGSSDTPSPEGTYKVTGVALNPWYSYSPSNFVQGNNLKPLSLPPGPNAPVGNIWIGLSKKSFGIHGTPNPSTISKTASHGCIRLTNWDANDLGRKVKSGVVVKFVN